MACSQDKAIAPGASAPGSDLHYITVKSRVSHWNKEAWFYTLALQELLISNAGFDFLFFNKKKNSLENTYSLCVSTWDTTSPQLLHCSSLLWWCSTAGHKPWWWCYCAAAAKNSCVVTGLRSNNNAVHCACRRTHWKQHFFTGKCWFPQLSHFEIFGEKVSK